MLEEIKPHLVELRKRLIISVSTLFVAFVFSFFFWEAILDWMQQPLLSSLPQGSSVIFTKVGEVFFTAMKVSFFAALILSMPVIFWQGWLFVAPGLYDNEKKLVIPFVVGATTMFLIGGAFAYYIVFPFAFAYLINFGSVLFTALPSISEYVSFFAKLVIGFGISFELPVVVFFLATLGLVTDKNLKDFFRYAVVIIFIFAALITPPDVLTQFLMATPLIILYGISILIAKAINPDKSHEEEKEEESNDTEVK